MSAVPYPHPPQDSRNLSDLKRCLDCRDLYQALVGTGRPSGKALVDRTPWREDRKPSLNVYADGWLDRATGERGDVFSLVQQIRGVNFSAAVEFVANWLGVDNASSRPHLVPLPRLASRPSVAAHEPPSKAWQLGAQKAVSEAEGYLWLNRPDAEAVRAYLRHERGLSDDTIRAYHLGYNPTWRKVTVGSQAHYLPPGIVIPWQLDGNLWSIKVRCRVGTLAQALNIAEDTDRDGEVLAKYRQLAGGNQAGALFNVDAIQPDKPVVFTEGELDAILGQQEAGDLAAFVTAGSASSGLAARWRERVQAALVVLLALDNDEAGHKATERLAKVLFKQQRTAPLPAGKDLTDFVVQHGGNVRAWLQALPHSQALDAWNSLPDSWRAATSAYLPDSLAPFLEQLAALGWFVPGYTFTRPQALTALSLTRATVDRALQAGEDLFWQRVAVLPPDSSSQNETGGSIGKTVISYLVLSLPEMTANLLKRAACRIWERYNPVERGRPLGKPQAGFFTALGYSPEEAEQIVVELDTLLQPTYRSQNNAERFSERQAKHEYERLKRSLSDTHSTPLPEGWKFTNVQEYRACFARAVKQANPDRNFSLKEWAEVLGISQRTVAAVLVRAGIASVAQYQEAEVRSIDEATQVGRKLKGYPKRLIIQSEGQREHECRFDREQLAGALRLGQRCTIRYQLANRQTLETVTQPEHLPKRTPRSRPTPNIALPNVAPSEKPTVPRYFGPGYNPAYVRAWVVQACELARGYSLQRDGRLIDGATGEVLAEEPSGKMLLNWLLYGGVEVYADLAAWAVSELGATISIGDTSLA